MLKVSFGEAVVMEPDSPNQFDDDPLGKVFGQLEGIITSRKASKSERSYTSKLLAAGVVKIGSKVTEEAGELVEAAINEVDERVISEAADLFYHAMVLLACRDVTLKQVEATLAGRFGVSGLDEKASRK